MTGIIDTLSPSQQIELIYVGYFNRSGDSAGFLYWGNEYSTDLAKGETSTQALNQIANEFQPQPETLALYPFLATQNPPTNSSQPGWDSWVANVNTLVQSVYQNLFDRAADSAGLTYWTNQIATGAVPLGEAILAIANGATGADATLVTNKVTVALDFTTQTGAAGLGVSAATTNATLLAQASSVLTGVTTDPASVTAAEASTQAFIAGGTASAINLTTGVDHVTGQNVTVNGVLNANILGINNTSTLNATDTFNPTGTNNTLNVSILAPSLFGLSPNGIDASTTPVLTNVQHLNVTNNASPLLGAPGTAVAQHNLAAIAPALTSIGVVNDIGGNVFQGINGAMVQTFSINGAANAVPEDFGFKAGLTSAAGTAPTGTAALTLANNAKGLDVEFLGGGANDGIANLTVHSTGAGKNALADLIVHDNGGAATLQVLTIDGAAALSVTQSIDFFNGKVDIEAAAATGALTLDVSSNLGSAIFNGGSGLDTLTVSDQSLTALGTALNGGTGHGNTLEVAGLVGNVGPSAEYAAINATHGFDTLGLINPGFTIIDASQITVLNHYAVEASSNTVDIGNLASGSTVDVLHNTGGTDTFSSALVPNSTLNLNIGNAHTTGLTIADIELTTGGADHFTMVNLSSNGAGTVPNTISDLGIAGGETFNVSGSHALAVDFFNSVAGNLTGVTVAASNFTGAFFDGLTNGSITNIQIGDAVDQGTTGFGDVITTGSGQSTIVEAASSNAVVTAPATAPVPAVGNPDTITFGAHSGVTDSVIYAGGVTAFTGVAAAGSVNVFETVKGFELGTDAVGMSLGGAAVNQLTVGTGAEIGLANTQVNSNGLILNGFSTTNAFLTALAGSAATHTGDVLLFNDNAGDVYVAEATGTAAGDWHVIELTGGVTATVGITNHNAAGAVSGALAHLA